MMQRAAQPLVFSPGEAPTVVGLWRRWVLANAVGEWIGLGLVAALAGGALWYFGEPRTSPAVLLFTSLMILLGAGEGLILGYAQWLAAHPFLHALSRREWMKATTLGAVIAWGLGMIPSTLIALQETTIATPPAEITEAVKYSMAALMGFGLGLALGVPQWLVLRRYVTQAGWWVAANALAWAVGMPIVFVGAGSVPQGKSGLPMVLLMTVTLLVAGAVVGAIHGWALIWLLSRRHWRRNFSV